MLRRVDRSSVKLQLTFDTTATADRMLAEDHAVFRRFEREHAQVEELVVQRAQRQAVGLDVRPTDVMPLDVRGLQARRRVSDAQVEPADAAPLLIGTQNPLAKSWVTPATFHTGVVRDWHRAFAHFACRIKIKTHGGGDVGVQGRREVCI